MTESAEIKIKNEVYANLKLNIAGVDDLRLKAITDLIHCLYYPPAPVLPLPGEGQLVTA